MAKNSSSSTRGYARVISVKMDEILDQKFREMENISACAGVKGEHARKAAVNHFGVPGRVPARRFVKDAYSESVLVGTSTGLRFDTGLASDIAEYITYKPKSQRKYTLPKQRTFKNIEEFRSQDPVYQRLKKQLDKLSKPRTVEEFESRVEITRRMAGRGLNLLHTKKGGGYYIPESESEDVDNKFYPQHSAEDIMLRVAEKMFDNQLAAFDTVGPPNAESTIEKKGSDQPLVDTGALRSSIDFWIE